MACEPDNDLEGGREFRSGAIEASLYGAEEGYGRLLERFERGTNRLAMWMEGSGGD